jgi:hypothetical protein
MGLFGRETEIQALNSVHKTCVQFCGHPCVTRTCYRDVEEDCSGPCGTFPGLDSLVREINHTGTDWRKVIKLENSQLVQVLWHHRGKWLQRFDVELKPTCSLDSYVHADNSGNIGLFYDEIEHKFKGSFDFGTAVSNAKYLINHPSQYIFSGGKTEVRLHTRPLTFNSI